MRIIFSHGKESGPDGSKISAMSKAAEKLGFATESIDYRDLRTEPDARVDRLLDHIDQDRDVLLVGSSMGGYVSLVAAGKTPVKGLFLLAPAISMNGYDVQEYPTGGAHTELVHGWSDQVCSPERSITFAREANCTIHLISGDHSLISSLETVLELFDGFLRRCSSVSAPRTQSES